MYIDLQTLAIVLGLAAVLEAVVFFVQFRINKTYRGIGWWALGSSVLALGYLMLPLRDFITVRFIAIILPNVLIVSGIALIYIGVTRFLGRSENRKVILPVLATFLVLFSWFTYTTDDITMRTAIVSVTIAVLLFLIVQALAERSYISETLSARFLSVALLADSGYLLFYSAFILTVAPVGSLFAPTALQVINFFAILAEGILLTFGLIAIVNQRLNAEVAEARDRFEMMFDASPDAALFTRMTDSKIVNVNKAFAVFTGFDSEDTIGKSTLDLNIWVNINDRQKYVDELRKQGYYDRVEIPFIRKDGIPVVGIVSARIITLRGIPHVISVIHDITRRKHAEEALRQANRKLNLLSGITRHDITNQLTALRSYLFLIEQKQADLTLDTDFLKMSDAAERIASILSFAKEYEEIGIRDPVWQDLHTIIAGAAGEFHLGPIKLDNDVPAGTGVFADPLIVKVFYNLMDNAVRYGGKITTIRFSVGFAHGGRIVIVCEDDGVGVLAEEKEKIFLLGYGKNTGLGLALSREILSITGITICENGAPEKGARFEIIVPGEAFRSGDPGVKRE